MEIHNQNRRVGIIGTGNVGSSVAFILATQGIAEEIILLDLNPSRAQGIALDLCQTAAATKRRTTVRAAQKPSDMAGCDVIVFSAGSARLPGMSRDDLLLANAKVTRSVLAELKPYIQESVLIMVSNPLDAMVYTAIKESGLPPKRVLGMAGVLDSARFASFIFEKLGYGSGQITASVMGGHGDDMVPLPRYSSVAGVPITELLSPKELEEIIKRTQNAGAEIVGYLQKGSAYFAPAQSTAIMVEAILTHSRQIFPCSVLLQGEYGYHDVVGGVPVRLGKGGVEEIIELDLIASEKELFERSIDSVRSLIEALYNQAFFGESR